MGKSAFDTLVDELCSIATEMNERNDFKKSFADSQALGKNHLTKLQAMKNSLTGTLCQRKLDAAKAEHERSEALLEKAKGTLASGTLDPYRTDLLKQHIHELERSLKGEQ